MYGAPASRRLTSGSASFASGFTGSYGRPAQSVSSLSCRRSCTTPPKTIAPSRPLPTGSARTHSASAPRPLGRDAGSGRSAAGCRYQRLSGDDGGGASPVKLVEAGVCGPAASSTAAVRTSIESLTTRIVVRSVIGLIACLPGIMDEGPAPSRTSVRASPTAHHPGPSPRSASASRSSARRTC